MRGAGSRSRSPRSRATSPDDPRYAGSVVSDSHPSSPPTLCPHCGGDLTPGAPRHRPKRLKGPDPPPRRWFWHGFGWWQIGVAVLVALIGVGVAILALGSGAEPPPAD